MHENPQCCSASTGSRAAAIMRPPWPQAVALLIGLSRGTAALRGCLGLPEVGRDSNVKLCRGPEPAPVVAIRPAHRPAVFRGPDVRQGTGRLSGADGWCRADIPVCRCRGLSSPRVRWCRGRNRALESALHRQPGKAALPARPGQPSPAGRQAASGSGSEGYGYHMGTSPGLRASNMRRESSGSIAVDPRLASLPEASRVHPACSPGACPARFPCGSCKPMG